MHQWQYRHSLKANYDFITNMYMEFNLEIDNTIFPALFNGDINREIIFYNNILSKNYTYIKYIPVAILNDMNYIEFIKKNKNNLSIIFILKPELINTLQFILPCIELGYIRHIFEYIKGSDNNDVRILLIKNGYYSKIKKTILDDPNDDNRKYIANILLNDGYVNEGLELLRYNIHSDIPKEIISLIIKTKKIESIRVLQSVRGLISRELTVDDLEIITELIENNVLHKVIHINPNTIKKFKDFIIQYNLVDILQSELSMQLNL
jgi:hypothetical protein